MGVRAALGAGRSRLCGSSSPKVPHRRSRRAVGIGIGVVTARALVAVAPSELMPRSRTCVSTAGCCIRDQPRRLDDGAVWARSRVARERGPATHIAVRERPHDDRGPWAHSLAVGRRRDRPRARVARRRGSHDPELRADASCGARFHRRPHVDDARGSSSRSLSHGGRYATLPRARARRTRRHSRGRPSAR